MGADFLPASSDLVQMVQNAIDSPPGQGLGLGLAPIGAQVTVTAPKTVPVDISATLTLASGHELETVQQPAQDAVSDYLLQIRKNWMSISAVRPLPTRQRCILLVSLPRSSLLMGSSMFRL